MIGQTVGKYRVQDRIGRGGMGTVYLATDETLRREVAIKVLNSELNDPEIARRFRSEAITVARLSHPGIATVYELFEHDGQWLMVMEFVRGETLEKTIEKTGPMPVDRAVDLVIQGLTALAHAHSMGVVHRDLKPANLMVTPTGTLKIMDFGIARVAGSEHLTAAGFMMGTPAYMAPEQVMGHEIDARADLYAMGVVLYRLTTSKLPFKGETPFAMAQSQVNDPPTPVRLMRSELPLWIEQVTTRALSKAPVDRFQTADEFREALKRGLAGLPIETTSTPFVPPELLMTTPMPISGDTSPGGVPNPHPASIVPPAPPPPPETEFAAATVLISGSVPMPSGAIPSGATSVNAAALSAAVANATPATTTTPAMPTTATPTTATPTATVAAPPAKRSNTMIWIAAAALVVLAVVGTILYRKHAAKVAGDAATALPAPIDTAAVPPPPQPITPDIPQTVVPPSATGANANPTSAGAGAPSTAANAAGASTDPNASGASGAGARAGAPGGTAAAPARGATVPATPGTNPATTGHPGADSDAHVAFGDVKILAVTDKRGTDQDVVLNFVAGQISVAPRKGGAAVLSVPYNRIAHMTYVHAKDPKWYPDPTLSMPPDGMDIPGFMRGARHWLVLQTRTNYLILRLDDSDFSQILDTVESRTGIKVDRPAPGK